MAGTTGFVYRVRPDGTGLQQALDQPILAMVSLSPDGRWLVVWALLGGNGAPAFQAFPLNGGPPVILGTALAFQWSSDGAYVSITSASDSPIPDGRSYLVPLPRGQALPRIPPGGFNSEEEIAKLPGAHRIEAVRVVPAASPDTYAFYRGAIQRNLYRIPIP